MEKRPPQKAIPIFSLVKPWGVGYMMPELRKIIVSCESLPKKNIYVAITKGKTPEEYYDNYMDHVFEPQVKEYLKDVAAKYFENFTVEINIRFVRTAEGVLPTTTFEEYIVNENNRISASIDIETSDEETIRAFLDELKELGLHFSLDITIMSAQERLTALYFHEYEEVFIERRSLR